MKRITLYIYNDYKKLYNIINSIIQLNEHLRRVLKIPKFSLFLICGLNELKLIDPEYRKVLFPRLSFILGICMSFLRLVLNECN